MHSLKSALSCKVFIPFYFRIHGSTPHLFSLSGFKAHTCNQNLFQVTRSVLVKAKQEDRSLIAWEGFPFLSSEKVRLSNSRSEPRGGWRRVVGVYQQHVEQKKLCLSPLDAFDLMWLDLRFWTVSLTNHRKMTEMCYCWTVTELWYSAFTHPSIHPSLDPFTGLRWELELVPAAGQTPEKSPARPWIAHRHKQPFYTRSRSRLRSV